MDEGEPYKFSKGITRDGMVIELASKTRLTERRRWMLQMDGEAGDKVLGVHRAEVVEIDVGAVLVPKCEVSFAYC